MTRRQKMHQHLSQTERKSLKKARDEVLGKSRKLESQYAPSGPISIRAVAETFVRSLPMRKRWEWNYWQGDSPSPNVRFQSCFGGRERERGFKGGKKRGDIFGGEKVGFFHGILLFPETLHKILARTSYFFLVKVGDYTYSYGSRNFVQTHMANFYICSFVSCQLYHSSILCFHFARQIWAQLRWHVASNNAF